MVTYQLKNNPKVIHGSYVSKNSVPKVYHRKIMFKTFGVYQKPFHSHDWQSRFRSLPCHFPSQNCVGSWNSTRHIFQRKSLGSPIPQVEMKHPFSKTLKIYSFFLWGSLLCVRSFQNEKMHRFLRSFWSKSRLVSPHGIDQDGQE